jgi:hypothetical protein
VVFIDPRPSWALNPSLSQPSTEHPTTGNVPADPDKICG